MSTVARPEDPQPLAVRSPVALFLFWVPLAAQWLMMAAELPFLAAVIARGPDPAFNLAAYGVAFAFAILIESPVIMLMSAATALVEDAHSYRRLRNFANALNAGSTALLLLVLVPPVHQALMGTLLGLPQPVVDLVYGALWFLLPWPAAIGYRRFLHGVLIRSGRTRLVAYGTVLRLLGMASTALLLLVLTDVPGAWLGAVALSAGVSVEALASRIMARGALREVLSRKDAEDSHGPPAYSEIARFYYPLTLTSFIGLTVQPMLTFFMARSPSPVESLAVFPVVHSLTFVFRSVGFSFQEVVIALVGRRFEHVAVLFRFGLALMLAASGALALVAFTALAVVWFETVSGLTPELAAFAIVPTRASVALPALAVLLALQHGLLVRGRMTGPVTLATVCEVLAIATLFTLFGWVLGVTGVTSAMVALVGGRAVGNLVLAGWVRRVLARAV